MIRPRVVLFDLDNTVYPYAPCHRAGLDAAGAAFGDSGFEAAYDAARERVKRQVGKVAAAHCRLLYFKALLEEEGQGDLKRAIALHEAYWHGYFSAMKAEPGAAALFQRLRGDGVRTAWVTDFTTERQIKKLAYLGLEDALDLLITSEEAGAEKPDPRGVDLALRRLGAEGVPGWFVGDDVERDLQPGKLRGLTTVWFARPGKAPSEAPDATVTTWTELTELYDRSQ